MEDHNECIKWASKALEIDNECKKGYLRRAMSYFDKGDYDLAKKDLIMFQKLAKRDDNEKEVNLAKLWLNKIADKKQKQLDRQRELYGGFLDKQSKNNVSLYDDKENDDNDEKNDDGFCWKIIMFIPNLIMNCVDECTKYCRKKSKDD